MPASIARFVPGWNSMQVDLRVLAVTVALALRRGGVRYRPRPAVHAPAARRHAEGGLTGRNGRPGAAEHPTRPGRGRDHACPSAAGRVGHGRGGAHRFLYGHQGYDPDRVLVMEMVLPRGLQGERRQARIRRARARSRRRNPGAERAAVINIMPARGNNSSRPLEIEGRPNADPAFPPSVDFRSATPEIFAVLGIPVASRPRLTPQTGRTSQPVVVISQSLAQRTGPTRIRRDAPQARHRAMAHDRGGLRRRRARLVQPPRLPHATALPRRRRETTAWRCGQPAIRRRSPAERAPQFAPWTPPSRSMT